MKKLFSVLAILFAVQFSYAQNTYPWPSSGNVTIRSGVNALPATSGSTQAGGTLRIEGGDNAVIDLGTYSINTWLQATDKTDLSYRYNLNLNPMGGNVGIGTTNPIDLLHLNVGAYRKGITISSDGDANAYTDIQLPISTTSTIANGAPLGWDISHRKDGYFSDATGGSSLEFYAYLKGGNYYAPLSFKPNGDIILASAKNALGGNVAIGTTDPQGHKLAVNGDIIATKITVKPYGNWPDYVFKPSYTLLSLSEVKSYIDQNQHLPDMPSEQEVAKEGVDLGEIVKLQTKKIEELTLYLIEKDKEINDIKTSNQKEIESLKQSLETLTKEIHKN